MKLLVIEDNDLDAERIERLCRKQGIPVSIERSTDGETALGLLRQWASTDGLDAIFLDINMPRMNGIEFLQALRAGGPEGLPPIYVLSTSDRRQDILDALEHGAKGYYLKPLGTEDLIDVIAASNAEARA